MKIRYRVIALIIFSFKWFFTGVTHLSLCELIQFDDEQVHILLVSRLARLMGILIAGMSIGIARLIMQQLSKNKFVSPTTAGTLDSARFGIIVSMMVFTSASPFQKMTISFLFALLGTLIFMKVLEKIQFKNAIFIHLVVLSFD